jgi:hypothetical protein
MKQPNIERDGIGAVAVWQMQRALGDPRAEPLTRKILRKALKPLGRLVEEMCPTALQMTPQGLVSAYGPMLNGHVSSKRHLFLIASSDDAAGAILSEWVDIAAARKVVENGLAELFPNEAGVLLKTRSREELWGGHKEWRASVWVLVSRAVAERQTMNAAVAGVMALMGDDGKRLLADQSAVIRAKQLLPAVCALVGVKKEKGAAGVCSLIMLPPAIDLALAETGAAQ